jgi:hypothetical protein
LKSLNARKRSRCKYSVILRIWQKVRKRSSKISDPAESMSCRFNANSTIAEPFFQSNSEFVNLQATVPPVAASTVSYLGPAGPSQKNVVLIGRPLRVYIYRHNQNMIAIVGVRLNVVLG